GKGGRWDEGGYNGLGPGRGIGALDPPPGACRWLLGAAWLRRSGAMGWDGGKAETNPLGALMAETRLRTPARVRPKHIVEEVVINVGPEQRPEPGDEPAPPPRPSRAEKSAVKARRRELRPQRDVGDGAVAEHPGSRVVCPYAGSSECASRRGGKPVARAAEPRGRDAGARCQRTPSATASPCDSNIAITLGKPLAASDAPSRRPF